MASVKEIQFSGRDVLDSNGDVVTWDDITDSDSDYTPACATVLKDSTASQLRIDTDELSTPIAIERPIVLFSEQAMNYITQIDEGIEKSRRGGYRTLKVDGVSLGQFLAVRLKNISLEERQRIQRMYFSVTASRDLARQSLHNDDGSKPWDDADWAQRASRDY